MEIDDIDNDEDDVTGVLSTTDVNEKSITIEDASLNVSRETLNNRDVVLGGESYELAYRARVDAGDAADIKVQNVTFSTNRSDLDDVVDNAILTIDGVKYEKQATINDDGIDFSRIDAIVDAGTTNAKMTLEVKLKSSETVSGTLSFAIDEIDAEDADDRDEITNGDGLTITAGTTTLLTLQSEGELTVSFDGDDDSSTTMNMFTEQSKYALAGSSADVVLARVKLKADREAMEIEKMVFSGVQAGDFNGSVETLAFVLEDDLEERGTVDNYVDGSNFVVEFDNLDVTVDANQTVYGYVIATFKNVDLDVNAIEAGAEDGASLDTFGLDTIEFEGSSSNKDETELDLTNNASWANLDVTVVANTIAAVQLEAVKTSIVAGENLIARLKVTPTTQDWNVDAEGDVFNGYLSSVDLATTASYTSGAITYTIRKVGTTAAGSIDGSTLTEGSDREVDGTTTFEIWADVTEVTDSEANIQTKLDNVTTDVVFSSKTSGTTVNYLLPEGVSATTIVNTK